MKFTYRTASTGLVGFVCCLLILIHTTTDFSHTIWPGHPSHTANSELYRAALAGLKLSSNFKYNRQCLSVRQDKKRDRKHADVTTIDGSFLSTWQTLNTAAIADNKADLPAMSRACERITTVELASKNSPDRFKHDTSVLILGVATTLDRLLSTLPQMSHWLANTEAHLLVILRDQPTIDNDAVRAAEGHAQLLGIKLTVVARDQFDQGKPSKQANGGEAENNFGLVRAFYHYKTPRTRWFAVIDDDTFFVSLQGVLEALTRYDPSDTLYIGTQTEHHLGASQEPMKATGGAGMFLSLSLVDTLMENFDICMGMAGQFGDILWSDCILKVTSPTVRISMLTGLHQLDVFGDLAGFYESGSWPLLTLHHWKSWHKHSVPEAHLATRVAGINSFLNRWLWTDEKLLLTNGFSIVQYPDQVPDLGLIEKTFDAYPGRADDDIEIDYQFAFGKMRPRLQEGKHKISWRMERAIADGNIVRQFYVKRGVESNDDSVIEIDWIE